MFFTDSKFFFVLPVIFICYWVIPNKFKWTKSLFLLIVSYLFYLRLYFRNKRMKNIFDKLQLSLRQIKMFSKFFFKKKIETVLPMYTSFCGIDQASCERFFKFMIVPNVANKFDLIIDSCHKYHWNTKIYSCKVENRILGDFVKW